VEYLACVAVPLIDGSHALIAVGRVAKNHLLHLMSVECMSRISIESRG
jgi:hypothetical protein